MQHRRLLRPFALARDRPDGGAINNWLATPEEQRTLPPAGPVDEALIAWVFKAGGRPVAVLWNCTLHVNTHFGPRFSADYPGAVAAALQREFGDGFFTAYLPGACADINVGMGKRYDDVHPLIATAVADVIRSARPSRTKRLGAVTRQITLPVRDTEPFQEAEIRAKWPAAFDVFENEHPLLAARDRDTLTTVAQAVRIGDGIIACTPGEYFVQLGLSIKEQAARTPTVVAELCNDYIGYVPTREAYAQGGYECFRARTSQVAPGAGEQIADALVEMLGGLW
jgi:hypothetical protein